MLAEPSAPISVSLSSRSSAIAGTSTPTVARPKTCDTTPERATSTTRPQRTRSVGGWSDAEASVAEAPGTGAALVRPPAPDASGAAMTVKTSGSRPICAVAGVSAPA